jgi:hypothetical protein
VIDGSIAKDDQSAPAPGADHGGIARQDDWFEDGALQIEARITGHHDRRPRHGLHHGTGLGAKGGAPFEEERAVHAQLAPTGNHKVMQHMGDFARDANALEMWRRVGRAEPEACRQ